ncbi:hypothetical protein RUND412_006681 [Rhizina undulata]
MFPDVAIKSAPALLLGGAVLLLLTRAFMKVMENRKIHKLGGRARYIPSRWGLFGLDEAFKVYNMAHQNRSEEHWNNNFKESGRDTLEMTILGNRVVLTQDPENIKAVLATQFHDYGKGEPFHLQWKAFLGDSIFTTDGPEWHQSRQLIRPQFIKNRVSDLHTFEKHILHMISLIPKDGSTVDVSDLFFRFTLDSATDFLLGESVDSLGSPRVKIAQAFQDIQQYMNDVSQTGPMKFLLPKRKFNKNIKVLNSFVEPFVERTLQLRPDELKDNTESDYNFLHALAKFTRDPRVLRDQIVSVLLAARDTTAGTLSWALYELSKRPDVVDKLRKEILEKLSMEVCPTYGDLKEMKYLQHVIQETLRLYPAVPFNIRMSLQDTYLPHGSGESGLDPVGMPKGTSIAYSALNMQRREDLFGPDVAKFEPDRWATWTPKSWQYIPFNAGPRICLGQQFALTEMTYTLVRLFQHFESVESRETIKQFTRCEITISPGAGVPVAFRSVRKP